MNPQPKNKPTKLNPAQWRALCDKVYTRDRGFCQLCDYHCTVPEYHHAIFRSQGGGDTLDNVLTLCFDCHRRGIHGGGKDADKLRRLAEEKMEEINHENRNQV